MRACSACDAAAPADAAWCGQCFTPMAAPAAAVAAPVATLTRPLAAAPLPTATLLPSRGGAMLSGNALALVITAIGVGALGMGASWLLGRDTHLEPATYIRYALVLTIGVYAVVGALIAIRLVPGIRLRWHDGRPASGILLGAACGGATSAALLAVVSGAAGHLSPDPRVVTLMSEGDVAHIVAAIGLTCLCAPLVEEVLFRGLLLESLRGKGQRVALVASGVAFAVWHLNPSALRYYALMGIFLGALYMKRGLACSMAAHAAFNGVLVVAALAVVLAPTKTVTVGDLSLSAPSGWGAMSSEYDGWSMTGPSGAELFVAEQTLPSTVTASPDQLLARMRTGAAALPVPGLTFDTATVRKVTLPAGVAVEVDLAYEGHGGTFVMMPLPGKLVEVAFMSGGSTKAQADFPRMLDSLRVA